MEETLVVTIPGQSAQLVPYRPLPGEGDDDIARRSSHKFVPGTIIGIDGAKWRIDGLDKVTLVYDPIDGMYPKGNPEVPKPKTKFEELVAKVEEPEDTILAIGSKQPRLVKASGPKVGEVWRSKDPRRKNPFTVTRVTKERVYTNDGREIAKARMSRYERVS